MSRSRKKKTDGFSTLNVSIEMARLVPLYVPFFDIPLERAQEVLKQLHPHGPMFPDIEEPYKHLPVDRSFIEMLEEMKPTPISYEKPTNFVTKEEQRKWHASRMREYRRKSNETLEKTREMLEGIKSQCTVNTVMLKNMLSGKTVEEEVKRHAAQFLNIGEDDLMSIPDILRIFQQYWHHRKIASESNYENRSLIYLERAADLQKQYKSYKSRDNKRIPCQLVKKIKDAIMKAQSYEFFMDDKRVRKVIKELQSVDKNLREAISSWLINNANHNVYDKSSLSK